MFRNILSVVAALALFLPVLDAQTPAGRRVSITIDDGPVVNEMTDLGNFQRITNGLVGSFQIENEVHSSLPLEVTMLFPGVSRPLHIFEPRYRAMVADALKGGSHHRHGDAQARIRGRLRGTAADLRDRLRRRHYRRQPR